MLALLVASMLASSPCARLVLDARIATDLRSVEGSVRCEGGSPPAVAAFARLLSRPAGLDDVNRPWLYPEGFDAADMTLWVGRHALDGEGAWQALPPDGPGVVRFRTRIPSRNGSFGRRDGVATLLGGWHPAFGTPGTALAPARIDFAVEVPPGTAGFVGPVPFGLGSPRVVRGSTVARFVPVLVSPGLEVRRSRDFVVVTPVGRRPGTLRDLTSGRDRTALDELVATLEDGADFAARQGLERRPFVVVVGPLRQSLVEAFDGGLLVSDRVFHLPRLEPFLRFHRLALWRGELFTLALPHARAIETTLPAALAADAVAVALRDRLGRERYGRTAYAPELLEPFAVIPEIESLVYAPQVPLADAYFDAVDERPTLAPTPVDFESSLPRGKLLYEKLVDWVGEPEAEAITRSYLAQGRPWLEVAREAAGASVAAALAAWLGPPPRLDYAVGKVTTRDGRIEVGVQARGPDAGRVLEPLTVRVEDARGAEHLARRIGPGPLVVEAPGPPRVVELDPAGRLHETVHPPGFDPRYDDRQPPRWRLLLNNVTGLLAVTNRQLTASADFSLHRVHDQRYRFDFSGVYSPEAYEAGGAVSYGWGDEVTPLRLSQRSGVALTAQRLRVEGGVGEPGYELAATAFHLYDTRPSPYTAYEGRGLSLRGTVATGVGRDGRPYGYGAGSASALALWPLGAYHSLVARVRGDLLAGDPPPQQKLRLGGRYTAGRGYEQDEARGTRRVVASIEDRHALSVDTRSDLGGLFVVTGIEGALFADAVYLPGRGDGCSRDVFFDVGYGVRVLLDVLGVSPSSLAVDVGVPLSRCAGWPDRPPVTVYLAFVQSFLVF